MTPPYDLDPVLPVLHHTWFNENIARGLSRAIYRTCPEVVVELGSWLGGSALYMAQLLRVPSWQARKPRIYCVDTWEGSPEHHEDPAYARLLPQLYEQFLSNVIHAGATDIIIPVRMTTDAAAPYLYKRWPMAPRLIYVDASHAYEDVKRDLETWYPLLAPGGTICGDDYAWDGVAQAAREFSAAIGEPLTVDRWYWEIEKPDTSRAS